MSATLQPRTSWKRAKKIHQNTKYSRLFAIMNAACSQNAPRSANEDLRLVANRATRKRSSATAHLQCPAGAAVDPDQNRCRDDPPEHELERHLERELRLPAERHAA